MAERTSSHRPLGDGLGAARAVDQRLVHLVGVLLEVGAALADGLEEAVQSDGQLLLDLDVADGPPAVAVLQFLGPRRCRG